MFLCFPPAFLLFLFPFAFYTVLLFTVACMSRPVWIEWVLHPVDPDRADDVPQWDCVLFKPVH